MTLSEDDVLKILRLVEESSFDSLQLEYGDIKLAVSKSGALAVPAVESAPVASAPDAAPVAAAPREIVQPDTTAVPSTVAKTNPVQEAEGLIAVKAPVVGVFYAAPEPGAAPFVSVGTAVESDSTVGLVEVMKVFNAVPAGLKGKIAKILVEDSELVEHGQPLFLVEPAGEAS